MRSCRARPARANAQAMVVTLPWPLTTLPRCPVPQAARPSFAEKLVVLGARHRNESAARESTLGFRLLQTVRSARAPFRELVFMSARQKRPKTAVDQYLSILFLETSNLRRQLYELKKLRYRVRQAELSARNRARRTPGTHRLNPPP